MIAQPRRRFLITLGFTAGLSLFDRLARAFGRPRGERTVAGVLEDLEPTMRRRFADLDTLTDGRPLAILAFKQERKVELWKEHRTGWRCVRRYKFTGYSGGPGPKLRQGDGQIPEGVYRVEYLNPNSSYHLSIKLDYPNDFDRRKAREDKRTNLGGDIFIHGEAATIGCIPVGNRNIEELFYLVGKNGIANTDVIISPYDMRSGRPPLSKPAVPWEQELRDLIHERLKIFIK